MPKIPPSKPDTCKACNGTGRSSKGIECYPCEGTGKQKTTSTKEKTVERILNWKPRIRKT